MTFLGERLPRDIAFGAVGGPAFRTEVGETINGLEVRIKKWSRTRGRWEISYNNKSADEMKVLVNFFRRAEGKANTFLFEDFQDNEVETGEGTLNGLQGTLEISAGVGHGVPTYQLKKLYDGLLTTFERGVYRPRLTGLIVKKGGVTVPIGLGSGEIDNIDDETGIVRFRSTQAQSITGGHTPGANHVITLGSAFSPNVALGNRVYISGVTGTAATLLNGFSHAVLSAAGAVITLSVATTGLTASGGIAHLYPQPADILTWTGLFDNLCRFDTDECRVQVVESTEDDRTFSWSGIPLLEVRE